MVYWVPAQVVMMALDWAGYGYAALIASGGVMGYVKAGLFDSCFF